MAFSFLYIASFYFEALNNMSGSIGDLGHGLARCPEDMSWAGRFDKHPRSGHGLASCPEDTHWQLVAGDTQTISRIA